MGYLIVEFALPESMEPDCFGSMLERAKGAFSTEDNQRVTNVYAAIGDRGLHEAIDLLRSRDQ